MGCVVLARTGLALDATAAVGLADQQLFTQSLHVRLAIPSSRSGHEPNT